MLIRTFPTAATVSALSIGAACAQSAAMSEPDVVRGAATTIPTTAMATTTRGQNAGVTTSLVTSGPVADTPTNRAKYGQPDSNAGKRTAPAGN